MTDLWPEQYGNFVVLGVTGAGKTHLLAEVMKTALSGGGDKTGPARNGDKPLNSRGETNDEK
jgi:hypothetical protein